MLQSLKQIWTASIRRQLMLGIAMVHAVLMTIFVFDLVSRQSSFLVDESRKQATSLAETLAANGTSWVLANDYIGMEEVIHSQHSFPGLHYAMFTDLHGQVLAFTDREQVGRYASDPISVQLIDSPSETRVLIDNQLLIDVAHPIMIKQRHIGWARVGISRAGIASNLEVVTNEGLLYTVLAIAVGVLFAWVMSRGLTQDTRRLAAFANRIESGERKEHCLLDRPDELGQLAYDMNRMLDTLVEREQEVAAMHTQILADEERLRYALEGSNDGLWDWDIINDQVYYSPRWKEMLGYRSQEVANTFASWEERVHPDDLPKALASIDAHMLDASKSLEILHRLRHKDGSWRWILSRARALRNTQGKPYRMVGTHVDVTEQKRLETVLSEERERALVTLHSIGDGVITTFADARIDYLNSVAEILTGWSKEDAHLRSLEEVFPIVDE
ncbi:MAG: PAS domain-containing protein, partial [Candidatus Thiodiazotropha sp. (ex Lucinoma borealis)]|nr:PAS domain-containing protein [Candidatus Thiodiazotropha sp. (ex Lucinoma borealis)]